MTSGNDLEDDVDDDQRRPAAEPLVDDPQARNSQNSQIIDDDMASRSLNSSDMDDAAGNEHGVCNDDDNGERHQNGGRNLEIINDINAIAPPMPISEIIASVLKEEDAMKGKDSSRYQHHRKHLRIWGRL
jgi:hypothetical protein